MSQDCKCSAYYTNALFMKKRRCILARSHPECILSARAKVHVCHFPPAGCKPGPLPTSRGIWGFGYAPRPTALPSLYKKNPDNTTDVQVLLSSRYLQHHQLALLAKLLQKKTKDRMLFRFVLYLFVLRVLSSRYLRFNTARLQTNRAT